MLGINLEEENSFWEYVAQENTFIQHTPNSEGESNRYSRYNDEAMYKSLNDLGFPRLELRDAPNGALRGGTYLYDEMQRSFRILTKLKDSADYTEKITQQQNCKAAALQIINYIIQVQESGETCNTIMKYFDPRSFRYELIEYASADHSFVGILCQISFKAGIDWSTVTYGPLPSYTSFAFNTWLNGTTPPSNTIGINGDFYADISASLYYLKVAGVWIVKGAIGGTGPQGPAGADGADGAQGPAGADGADGATGPQGPAGADGADGAQGPAGADGTNGTNGADGATGPAGADGTNGTNGADGATGATGPTGPTGPTGATGTSIFTSLGSSIADFSTTGTAVEVLLASVLILANTGSAGKFIYYDAMCRKTGSGGAAFISVRIHTSPALAGNQILNASLISSATAAGGISKHISIKSATNTAAQVNVVNDGASNQNAESSFNINWTVDQYLIFALRLQSTTDVGVLGPFTVTLR